MIYRPKVKLEKDDRTIEKGITNNTNTPPLMVYRIKQK